MSERMMVTCPGCDGVVSVSPTGDEAEVRCLKCDEAVYTRSAEGGEWWANVPVADPTVEKPVVDPVVSKPPEVPATTHSVEWMLPAGWVSFGLGIAGFIASYNVGPPQRVEERLLQAVLNPLFFIGVPLGFYWHANHRKARKFGVDGMYSSRPPRQTLSLWGCIATVTLFIATFIGVVFLIEHFTTKS